MDYWSLFVAFMGSDMKKFNANSPLIVETPINYLSSAFAWQNTPEGHDFWRIKSTQWIILAQNPPKLHKILAGIE